MTLEQFDAVIFDLDGTLIDTETVYRAAFMAAAADMGIAISPKFYGTLLGVASPERAASLRAAFGAAFPTDRFFALYYSHRAALLPARIPLCAGALPLLRQLEAPKAIATSASRKTAAAHLARAGLAVYFTHVATRDDVARGKPAPDAFLHAAERLGVMPERCVAIEDSPTGVAAAHAAGMRVIMVARRPAADTARQCTRIARDLEEVGRLLEPGRRPASCIALERDLPRNPE